MPRRRIPGPILPKPFQTKVVPGGSVVARAWHEPSDISPYLTQPDPWWAPKGKEATSQERERGWTRTFGGEAGFPQTARTLPFHMSPSQFGPHHFSVLTQSKRVTALHVNTRSPTSLEMEEPWRLEHPRLPGFDDNTGRLEPWQQTREEFAADPRSWHHATERPRESTAPSVQQSLDLPTERRKEGLHLGTMQAAIQRRSDPFFARVHNPRTRRATQDPVLGALSDFDSTYGREAYAGRPESNIDSPAVFSYRLREAPVGAVVDQNYAWNTRHSNRVYNNQSEDPGSTSIVVRDRSALMSHRDAVNEALAAGKPVPAHVLAEYGISDWHGLGPEARQSYRKNGVPEVPTSIHLPNSETHSPEYMRALNQQSSYPFSYRKSPGEQEPQPDILSGRASQPAVRQINPPRPLTNLATRAALHNEFDIWEGNKKNLPTYLQGNLFHEATLEAHARGTPEGHLLAYGLKSNIHPLETVYQRAFDLEQGRGSSPNRKE